MTKSYINKIKANIGIHATKKVTNVLDGTYTSVFTGRSMNFEDLRDYVPGDNMRDIEWKASSRSGKLLVKRYVAEKKHNMLFVMDTGLRMLGETNQGDNKKDIALYSMGTLAYLAYRNGDAVGAAYYKKSRAQLEPFRTGIVNIERLLSFCQHEIDNKSNTVETKYKSEISSLLIDVVSKIRKRMVVFVVTDMKGAASVSEEVLKRLKCVNDILFIITDDAVVTHKKERNKNKNKAFNLCTKQYIPPFIGENKKLRRLEDVKRQELFEEVSGKCKRCGIAYTVISSVDNLAQDMITLLEHHKYESKMKA